MGRKNKSYSKDLHQQAYEKLTGMQAFGQSKKQAISAGTEKDKIFSEVFSEVDPDGASGVYDIKSRPSACQ